MLEGFDIRDPETCESVPADGETMGEAMFRGNVVMRGTSRTKGYAGRLRGRLVPLRRSRGEAPRRLHPAERRSKDIIISGGENISSIEVEDALFRHPAVAAAAVVAKPDDKWGETPVAFVELKPDANVEADALIAWCRERLAAYKLPRQIVFGELPKTSTGKVQKYLLRERAREG